MVLLGISQDPSAERLHFLEWAPADGHPALPLALVESRGPLRVPVLTFPAHRVYVYSAAAVAPGLVSSILAPELRIAPSQLRLLPRLCLGLEALARDLHPAVPCVWYREDVAPRVLLHERWQGCWEDYWKARSDVIRRAPRRQRQMEREGELLFRSATTIDREAERALERAMDLHSVRWGRRVHGGSNMQRAQHRRRMHDMARHFALQGALRLDWLTWKGDVAALVLGARYGATWFFYWATFDPAAGRYSPGNVLYMHLLEEAFSAGLKAADFTLGATPYKELWTDQALEITTVLQAGPSAAGKLSFHLVQSARQIKAWYSRSSGSPVPLPRGSRL